MKYTVPAVGFLVLLWAAAAPVLAHHSPSAIFDMSKHVSVTGTLTRVDWINPHIVLTVEGKSDGGKVEQWTFRAIRRPGTRASASRAPILRKPSASRSPSRP